MNYLVGGVLILLWGVFMCLKPSILGGIFESWKMQTTQLHQKFT